MRRYDSYKDNGIQWIGEIPSHWKVYRNKDIFTESKELVGEDSLQYTLLSLTKHGVIVRDITENKGKFPKDFNTYKKVVVGNIIFCLFDVDETPRTVGLSEVSGMITGAYDIFEIHQAKIEDRKIELENKDSEIEPLPVSSGKGGHKDLNLAKLSDILEQFNDIHWQNIELVKEQIDSLPELLQADEQFVNAVKNSNKETAQKESFSSMMRIVIKMMNEHAEFCKQYLDNSNFQNAINERIFQMVYNSIQNNKAV